MAIASVASITSAVLKSIIIGNSYRIRDVNPLFRCQRFSNFAFIIVNKNFKNIAGIENTAFIPQDGAYLGIRDGLKIYQTVEITSCN